MAATSDMGGLVAAAGTPVYDMTTMWYSGSLGPTTANTYTAYSQATIVPKDVPGFLVFYNCSGTSNTPTDKFAYTLAVGAAGQEVPIVSDVVTRPATLSVSSQFGNGRPIYYPIPLKAGQRLSAKIAADHGSAYAELRIYPVPLPVNAFSFSKVRGYGVDIGGGLLGALVSLPGAGNSAWTEFGTLTETAKAISFWQFCGISTFYDGDVNIGVGPAGAETILFSTSSGLRNYETLRYMPWLPVNLPAGTRLSVRMAYGGGTGSGSSMYTYLYVGS